MENDKHFSHITYGFCKPPLNGVFSREQALDLWNHYEGMSAQPNFVWIQRPLNENEEAKIKSTV